MTASDALSPALKPPPPPFEAALEAVELELALGKRDTKQDLCEQIIRETVESVGGILLFQIRIGEGRDQRWVGAVAFAEEDRQEYAVISIPCDGSPIEVTPVTQSSLPLASLAVAYANLAQCWAKSRTQGTLETA